MTTHEQRELDPLFEKVSNRVDDLLSLHRANAVGEESDASTYEPFPGGPVEASAQVAAFELSGSPVLLDKLTWLETDDPLAPRRQGLQLRGAGKFPPSSISGITGKWTLKLRLGRDSQLENYDTLAEHESGGLIDMPPAMVDALLSEVATEATRN